MHLCLLYTKAIRYLKDFWFMKPNLRHLRVGYKKLLCLVDSYAMALFYNRIAEQ